MPSNRSDALLAEYREVSNNFRMLTDIRFKLLAFLPIAAGAATAVLVRGGATTLTFAFSLFGLVVTIGLVTYNARNDQLYDTLVARAAAIERYLGVPDGAFATARDHGSGQCAVDGRLTTGQQSPRYIWPPSRSGYSAPFTLPLA